MRQLGWEKREFMTPFMENLSALMTLRGSTETWLCERAGLKQGTLNGWKNKNRNPPVTDAFMIAKALGTTIEELLGERYDSNLKFEDPTMKSACDFFLSLSEVERHEALAAAMRAVRGEKERDSAQE